MIISEPTRGLYSRSEWYTVTTSATVMAAFSHTPLTVGGREQAKVTNEGGVAHDNQCESSTRRTAHDLSIYLFIYLSKYMSTADNLR